MAEAGTPQAQHPKWVDVVVACDGKFLDRVRRQTDLEDFETTIVIRSLAVTESIPARLASHTFPF